MSAGTRARGRVMAYMPWQLRDYVMDRGLPTTIITLLLGYLTTTQLRPAYDRNVATLPATLITKWGGREAARVVLQHDFNEHFLRSVLGSLVFLGALLAMNGIVANDRKQGHYRFLFSKPVRPSQYYGQAFMVHSIGYLALVTLQLLLFRIVLWPMMSVPLLQVVSIMFLLYAGITFMLSAIARWDWLSLVSFTVAGSFVWGQFGASTNPLAKLIYIFPPLHRTTEVYETVAKMEPLDWPLLGWFGGYGVLCFVIGLVVLRYRRLAVV